MKEKPAHIMVMRFSALGDIAMTIPVVRNLLEQHPSLHITFVSIPFAEPLFAGIERLHFYPADIKNEFSGFAGLYKLAKKIKKEISFDAVADLHDVLRTKLLRILLGKKNAVIDKGRKEKKELTRPVNKKLHPLKTGFQRYAEVFAQLGYTLELDIAKGITSLIPAEHLLPAKKDDHLFIGLAPFAKHSAKMYPLEKMEQVVDLLLQNKKIELLVFAAKNEVHAISNWAGKSGRLHIMAGRLSFREELNIISQLDMLISMDSANMHLASLFGVPVVSIWGGTHPFLGFYGWGQHTSGIVQTDLPCRPSSVFGNKDCPVHGKAGCMQQITPAMIYEKVLQVIG